MVALTLWGAGVGTPQRAELSLCKQTHAAFPVPRVLRITHSHSTVLHEDVSGEQVSKNFGDIYTEMPATAKRVSPISRQEKAFLLQLITEHKVIADKRTHGTIVVAKQRAWERIVLSFNSAGFGGPLRTVKQLQKIWDYLKQM